MIAKLIEKKSISRTVIDGGKCDKYCAVYDGACKEVNCSQYTFICNLGDKYIEKKETCQKVEIHCNKFDKLK